VPSQFHFYDYLVGKTHHIKSTGQKQPKMAKQFLNEGDQKNKRIPPKKDFKKIYFLALLKFHANSFMVTTVGVIPTLFSHRCASVLCGNNCFDCAAKEWKK